MQSQQIARPYAEAAFRVAKQESAIAKWQQFLNTVSTLFKNETLQSIIKNPFVSQIELVKIIHETWTKEMNEAQVNFLMLLAENHRLINFPAIVTCFEALQDQDAHYLRIKVTSAFELQAKAQTELEQKLKEKFKKQIKMESKIDPALMGGLQIKIGDDVLDISVQGQLKQLNQDLSRGV